MVTLNLPAERDPGYEDGGNWAPKILAALVALNNAKPDIDRLAEYLPPLSLEETFLVDDVSDLVGLTTATTGAWAVVAPPAPGITRTYVLVADAPTVGANWREVVPSGTGVTSFNGRTGAVTAEKSDVGLGNVNDTRDVDKPVSTPQAAAIGQRLQWTGAYLTGKVYAPNDLVSTPGGRLATARLAFTATGAAPTATTTQWDLWPENPRIVQTLAVRGTWTAGATYAVNDLVTSPVGGVTTTFRTLLAHTASLPAPTSDSQYFETWPKNPAGASTTGGAAALPAGWKSVWSRPYAQVIALPARPTEAADAYVEAWGALTVDDAKPAWFVDGDRLVVVGPVV